jgi:hypothetical protein
LVAVHAGAQKLQRSELSGRQVDGLAAALNGIRRIRGAKVELNAIEDAIGGQKL